MSLYSKLMGLQETIEFLEDKTNRKLSEERVLKIIEQNNLPIVFEYEGWAIWESDHAEKPLKVELKGHFEHINNSTMIKSYSGFFEDIQVDEAKIHSLDYCKIRSNSSVLEDNVPKIGDVISFANGGRSPLFSSQSQGYVLVKNCNIGLLRSDLEQFLFKSELSYEELQTRIGKLEAENAELKRQLEQVAIRQPNEDKELPYNSQMAVARLVHTLFAELQYDITKPTGKTNDFIVNASNLRGTPITKNFVAKWIELANQAKSDSTK